MHKGVGGQLMYPLKTFYKMVFLMKIKYNNAKLKETTHVSHVSPQRISQKPQVPHYQEFPTAVYLCGLVYEVPVKW